MLTPYCLQVHLLSTSNPNKAPQLVQQRSPGLEYFVSHHKGQLIILTNAHGAVNYQLMTAPLCAPSLSNWTTLIPERQGVALRDLEVFASHAILHELLDGCPAVSVLSLPATQHLPTLMQQSNGPETLHGAAGAHQHHADKPDMHAESLVDLPQSPQDTPPLNSLSPLQHSFIQQQEQQQGENDQSSLQQSNHTHSEILQQQHQEHEPAREPMHLQLQTIGLPPWVTSIEAGANLHYHTKTMRLHLSSPVHPQHTYDYNLDSGLLELLAVAKPGTCDPEDYICRRLWATSRDGTQVRHS